MGERSAIVNDDGRDLHLCAGHVRIGNQLSVPVFLTRAQNYFTITAVNDIGEGPPSNELLVTMDGSSNRVAPPGEERKPNLVPQKSPETGG